MTGMSDYSAQNWLAYITGKTAMPTLPTAYIALFTAVGSDAGTGFTEVSGGAYARVATSGATWAAPSGSAPSSISNAAAITFPQATANWGTVIAFGLYDAPTGGNLLDWDYLGNFPWLPCTLFSAAPAVFTSHAHGYAVADPVVFSTEYGGTAPTVSAGSLSGVLALAHAATDTFDVTNGGTAVNTSGTGDGMVRKIVQQPIAANVTAAFGIGTLILNAA
jgi:hypothetical protein